jgi:hypothetical protein
VSWSHFGAFSSLVGKSDGDTSHAFQDGTCKLGGRNAKDGDPATLVDQVSCDYNGGSAKSFVGRFDTGKDAMAYLRTLSDARGYAIYPFSDHGRLIGAAFVGNATDQGGAELPDIETYFCGLPNYVVEFVSLDKSAVDINALTDKYWKTATYPDALPPACNDDLSGPAGGSVATTDGAADPKQLSNLNDEQLKGFIQRGIPSMDVTAVDLPSGAGTELAVAAQNGVVGLWSWNPTDHSLRRQASGHYPVIAGTPPQATVRGDVLPGMDHATFIVHGTLSGDGSGNEVAFTAGADGKWGAIKAQNDGNLKPADLRVSAGGIGLVNEFDFQDGDLLTADCSAKIPISQCGGKQRVIKLWKWDGSGEFVFDKFGDGRKN